MQVLPSELAFSIFLQLRDPRDVIAAAQVCKAWNAFAMDNAVWKTVYEASPDGWRIRTDADELLEKRAKDPGASPFPYYLQEGTRSWRASIARPPLRSARPSSQGEFDFDFSDFMSDRSGVPGSETPPAASSSTNQFDYDYFLQHNASSSIPSTPAGVQRARQRSTSMTHGQSSSRQSHIGRLDWRQLYIARTVLEDRWAGRSTQDEGQKPFRPDYHKLKGHTDCVYCVIIDEADGRGVHARVITGSRDHTIRIWDVETLQCLGVWHGHRGSVLCLRLVGDTLYSGSSDGCMIIWDYRAMLDGDQDGDVTHAIKARLQHKDFVLDIVVDERHLVTCCKDGVARKWNRDTLQLELEYQAHKSPVNAGRLRGDHIVTIGGKGSVHHWEVKTGRLMSGAQLKEGAACVLFDDEFILVGTKAPRMLVWDANSGELLRSWKGHDELVRALDYNRQRKIIASAGYDGRVKLWRLSQEDAFMTLQRHHDGVLDVALGVSRMATVGREHTVCIRNFGVGLDTSIFA